uniref:Bloodthirsty-related gene family, member 31 n=1 Tax=Sinocyclocheilus grahami TaxID=75366 RepID=A0A672KHY0_SINGR
MGEQVLPSPPELDRAHRALIAKPKQGERPRAVIVRFYWYQIKEVVIRESRKRRGSLQYHGKTITIYDAIYSPEVLEQCAQYLEVTLDPDTANRYLILSDDGKQVSLGDIKQDVPENPKRFDVGLCVLAKQGFSSGRFYYEVQVKGKTEWSLGVARESINRKGKFIYTPVNGFWAVILRNDNQYTACESPMLSFSLKVKPEIVGVFVDYEEGLVSFYDVGSRSHIYSFTD